MRNFAGVKKPGVFGLIEYGASQRDAPQAPLGLALPDATSPLAATLLSCSALS
ncbi:MAG: hypothetical protein IT380_03570 [Myxococcales bacterium]|nr:hypothetical protein [Myxococcales bacterium]